MSLMRSEIHDVPLDASSMTLSDSAYVSPSSSLLSEPPIPESSTYLSRQSSPQMLSPQISPQPSPPVPRQVPPSESWNYDNYIEQPREFTPYTKPNVVPHETNQPEQQRAQQQPQHQQHQYQPRQPPQPQVQFQHSKQPPEGFYVNEEDIETGMGSGVSGSTGGRQYAADQFTSIGFAPPLLAALSYFFLWLGGLVVMLLEKKNLFVLFHAWQSLVSGSIAFVVQFIFIWSDTMYSLLWLVYLVFTLAMIVRVLNDAPSQRLFKLPYIGTWCEHRAINKIHYHSGTGNFYRL